LLNQQTIFKKPVLRNKKKSRVSSNSSFASGGGGSFLFSNEKINVKIFSTEK